MKLVFCSFLVSLQSAGITDMSYHSLLCVALPEVAGQACSCSLRLSKHFCVDLLHVLVRRLFASLIVASLCFTVLGGELRFPYIPGKHLALEPPRIHLVVWFRDSL